MKKTNGWHYGFVIVAWLIYAAISMTAPTAMALKTYHLSDIQLNLLKLTVVIPVLLIWLLATYGAVHFKRYAELIAGEPDGEALRFISFGLQALVVYLITSTLFSAVLPRFATRPWINSLIIAKNHVPLLAAFTAFVAIYIGSARLLKIANLRSWNARRSVFLLVPYCVFAAIFTWEVLHDPNLQVATNGQQLPTFAMPSHILLFSYVIPYLVLWFLGCMAALNINQYAKSIHGPIYRTSLLNFVTGIVAVVVFTIALQLLTTASNILIRLSLQALFLLVYALIALDAAGYVFIALGAKKLSRIEEVQ